MYPIDHYKSLHLLRGTQGRSHTKYQAGSNSSVLCRNLPQGAEGLRWSNCRSPPSYYDALIYRKKMAVITTAIKTGTLF